MVDDDAARSMAGRALNALRKVREQQCKICENQFSTRSSRALFCSEACKQKAKRQKIEKPLFDISCAACGQPIWTHDRRIKFCGPKCRRAAADLKR